MDSVLFPFTFLSDLEARGLAACFNRCSVWLPSSKRVPQAMQLLADKGLISLGYPFGNDDALLVDSLKQLEGWADLHGPGHLRQLAGHQATKRGNVESSMFSILDTLTSYQGMVKPGGQTIDPLDLKTESMESGSMKSESSKSDWIHQNRLFLQIAQAFDQRGQEIQNDMDAVDALTAHFHSVLHADSDTDETGIAETLAAYDHIDRAYMPAERVRAWTSFLAAPESSSFKPSGQVFVTTSRVVETLLIDAVPDIKPGLVLPHISIEARQDEAAQKWRSDLERWLLLWAKNSDHCHDGPVSQPPVKISNPPSVSLTVYRAELSPHEWLIKAVGNGETVRKYFDGINAERSTLLACVKNE